MCFQHYWKRYAASEEWIIGQFRLSSAVLVDFSPKAFSYSTFQRKLEMVLAFHNQLRVD